MGSIDLDDSHHLNRSWSRRYLQTAVFWRLVGVCFGSKSAGGQWQQSARTSHSASEKLGAIQSGGREMRIHYMIQCNSIKNDVVTDFMAMYFTALLFPDCALTLSRMANMAI